MVPDAGEGVVPFGASCCLRAKWALETQTVCNGFRLKVGVPLSRIGLKAGFEDIPLGPSRDGFTPMICSRLVDPYPRLRLSWSFSGLFVGKQGVTTVFTAAI